MQFYPFAITITIKISVAHFMINSTLLSGPAIGVVAGTKIPNYCVMSETANIAREIERHGEGMRILISETSRRLIDKVGGFRCESRGVLDIKPKGPMETFWLVGPDNTN